MPFPDLNDTFLLNGLAIRRSCSFNLQPVVIDYWSVLDPSTDKVSISCGVFPESHP